jgi:hypothetical protein
MKTTLFVPLAKVDEEKRIVYGIAATEEVDKTGEVFDYASSKPHFEAWSAEFEKATQGASKGNLRVMHGDKAAGKLTDLAFDDDARAVEIAAKVVDDDEWKKVLEGVYTGFSIGGDYVRRWRCPETKATRYTARPVEISLVDNPAMPSAHFEFVKSGGGSETRRFKENNVDKTSEGMTLGKNLEAVASLATMLADLKGLIEQVAAADPNTASTLNGLADQMAASLSQMTATVQAPATNEVPLDPNAIPEAGAAGEAPEAEMPEAGVEIEMAAPAAPPTPGAPGAPMTPEEEAAQAKAAPRKSDDPADLTKALRAEVESLAEKVEALSSAIASEATAKDEALKTLTGRLAKLESAPKPVGRPVQKDLGTEESPITSPEDFETFLRKAEAAGVSRSIVDGLRREAAVAMLRRAR